ncbi:MAG: hypothetical protein H7Y15_08125 [Pseudonocardia sp.]|nr:hypothetical protein [Pseudonocardia sp.]
MSLDAGGDTARDRRPRNRRDPVAAKRGRRPRERLINGYYAFLGVLLVSVFATLVLVGTITWRR